MTASVNYWPADQTAKAFWSQHTLPPYQELLKDTIGWVEPRPGQRWLDLGCGGGQLSRALWAKGDGQLAEVLGVDVAAANAQAYARHRSQLQPSPAPERFRFHAADFSHGFPDWSDAQFDGVISGLSLQYAECYDAETGRWTQAAYDRILKDVCRLLKPGGTFVFSVNVPEPAWGKVARPSLAGALTSGHPLRYLKKAWRMYRFGGWLTREARRGRFHYLPAATLEAKLHQAGLTAIEHRFSYSGQAIILRSRRPL